MLCGVRMNLEVLKYFYFTVCKEKFSYFPSYIKDIIWRRDMVSVSSFDQNIDQNNNNNITNNNNENGQIGQNRQQVLNTHTDNGEEENSGSSTPYINTRRPSDDNIVSGGGGGVSCSAEIGDISKPTSSIITDKKINVQRNDAAAEEPTEETFPGKALY